MYYTTWGSARQGCGHAHKTLAAAEQCLREDREGCSGDGYSDREIRAIETREEAKNYDTECGPGRKLMNEWEEE
jgi:hypothetical protein